MKKNLKNLWGKRIFSSFLSISFLLSGISPAFNVSAASPASVPDTLTLKESAGVCSGNSVAFNVRSNAFNSSKLKFYQDMLSGSHTKTNASTKSGAPNATSAEDWFDIAYILHRNRQSQSGTSNYSSRMEAMRYSTIAEYNNTGKISNNEYKGGYYGIFIATALIIVIHLVMQIQISVKNYMNIIWHSTRAVATKKAGIPATKVQQTALNLWKIIQIKMSFGLF